MKYRLGILATHPIQYFAPWYRALAAHPDIALHVFFAQRQTQRGQADAGFGVEFEWDIPLLDGYRHQFLNNVARRPSTDHFLGCDTPQIESVIAQEKFDAFLVGGWHSLSYWQAIRACRKSGTPLFVRGDSQLPGPRSLLRRALKYPLYRTFIPWFDVYLVVGERAKAYLRHYGADAAKMFSTPHAVDNEFFERASARFRQNRDALRRAWNLPAGAIVFLFAGKFVDRKRPMDFLKALRGAAGKNPNVAGLIVGDGALRSSIDSYIREHRLPVHPAGFLNQTELPKAYAAADALVLPSDGRESWGLVVNEAMGCGLPALVSDDVGCVPDLVTPGVTGERFLCGDVEALSALMRQWAEQPAEIARMGERAKARVAAYSVENAVRGTLSALEHVRGSWKAAA